jgi:hypothetical protein
LYYPLKQSFDISHGIIVADWFLYLSTAVHGIFGHIPFYICRQLFTAFSDTFPTLQNSPELIWLLILFNAMQFFCLPVFGHSRSGKDPREKGNLLRN